MATRPSKKRRLTPTVASGEPGGNTSKMQKAFFKNAAGWNLEQDYELRRKKGKKEKESNRLPIKTRDGQVRQPELRHSDAASIASDEWLPSDGDDPVDEASQPAPEQPQIPEREQLRIAKEELAKIAMQLNEDPEEHPGAFKALARIGESQVVAIQKLALLTQMSVYKDVIPGYRIRPTAEDLAGEKLSKDVRRLRQYEQALVSGYHHYLKTLAKVATSSTPPIAKGGQSMPALAITCACTLLNAVPHFNFRGDVLRILVRKLSTRAVDESFVKCRQALETMLAEDEEGRASMEAVSLLTKMMKARNYHVDETVLNLFLHLRLLSEFSGTASRDMASQPNGKKKKKKDREFRTKRERKLLKEQKAAEKVMAEADAAVSHEERDQLQSETLKMVFATYFRILKVRSPRLMGAVLEGLAKYAHLINQDFFGDLLEALKDLIRNSDKLEEAADEEAGADNADDDDVANAVRDTSREALLCTVTAFALLAGQDAHNARADLHLDLTFFTTHLYRSLLSLSVNPDLELGAKSLHLPDPDSPQGSDRRSNKVNLQTTTVLLMRCLGGVLLPSWNIRSVPPARLAAFTKQLMTTALHMPEKSNQAVLGLLQDVIHTHGKKVNALWNTEERKGDGTYNALGETVEGSNPFAATVWEGEILKKHYCPKVREEVKLLEKNLAKIRD